jgi:hypothetical protein
MDSRSRRGLSVLLVVRARVPAAIAWHLPRAIDDAGGTCCNHWSVGAYRAGCSASRRGKSWDQTRVTRRRLPLHRTWQSCTHQCCTNAQQCQQKPAHLGVACIACLAIPETIRPVQDRFGRAHGCAMLSSPHAETRLTSAASAAADRPPTLHDRSAVDDAYSALMGRLPSGTQRCSALSHAMQCAFPCADRGGGGGRTYE